MREAAMLCFTFLVMSVASAGIGQTQGHWSDYTSTALGFSIRYPGATLQPVIETWPSPNKDWPSGQLDLVTREIDPNRTGLGHVTALRIRVNHLGPSSPLPMSFYRHQKGYYDMKVGGRRAGNYISCGRAACHWTVVVYGSSEVFILTMDPDEDRKPGPDDTRYPLRAMIDSIVFDPAFPK